MQEVLCFSYQRHAWSSIRGSPKGGAGSNRLVFQNPTTLQEPSTCDSHFTFALARTQITHAAQLLEMGQSRGELIQTPVCQPSLFDQLSDDSDIEEHPNVDKKSMIRWKQRDIHEKREARKLNIAKLNSELSLNTVLRPRIKSVLDGLQSKGVDHYRAVQRRLRESPSSEKPDTGAPNQPTYDMMMTQLLGDVWREAAFIVDGAKVNGAEVTYEGKKVDDKTPIPTWAEGNLPDGKTQSQQVALEERLSWHLKELDRRDVEVKKEIEQEEGEQKKKITSENIKDGWSASSVAKPSVSPLEDKPKPKKVEKKETIEVLNPGASVSIIVKIPHE